MNRRQSITVFLCVVVISMGIRRQDMFRPLHGGGAATLFAIQMVSKSLTQRRKDAEISDRSGRRPHKRLVPISEN